MRDRRTLSILGAVLAASACASKPLPAVQQAPEVVEPFRPGWTAGLALHIDEIRLCLAERQPPTAVVHVQELASGPIGITAIDGLGHAENCAVQDGRVVLRKAAELEPADLEGMPFFAAAPTQPHVSPGVLLEDVEQDDIVIGWLYWPSTSRPTVRDRVDQD